MGKIYKRASVPEKGKRFEHFVGRKKIIEAFWNDYESIDCEAENWEVNVINYFGMPGIGKTELANQLFLQHVEKDRKVFSFTFSKDKSFYDNMLELKTGIEKQFKLKFPMFDIAVLAYYRRSGRVVEKEALKLYLDNDIVNSIYPIMGLNPIASVIAGVVQAFKPLEAKFKRKVDEDAFAFFRESSEVVYSKLAYYFMADLAEALKERKEASTIILDNAEICIDSFDFKEWFLGSDGILRHVPNVIWCFFSQREIRDEEELTDKVIRKVPINAFDTDEVKEYLTLAGIDVKYHDDIILGSEGIPVYLDILSEIYIKKVASRSIEDFDAKLGKDGVISWYFRQLDDDSKTILQILALLETWDDDEVLFIIEKMGIGSEKYAALIEHSYIKWNNGKYYLHSLIQEALLGSMSDVFSKAIKRVIESSPREDLKDLFEFADIKAKLYMLKNDEELNHSILELGPLYEKYKKEMDFARIHKLHHIVTVRARNYSNKLWAESYSYASYGRLLLDVGLANEALDLYSKAVLIIDTCDTPKYLKREVYTDFALYIREEYANALYHLRRYEEANNIRAIILKERRRLNSNKGFETLAAEQNLYNGQVHMEALRNEALIKLEKILTRREKIIIRDKANRELNIQFSLYAIMGLAIGYLEGGNIELAYERAKEAYEKSNTLFGPNDLRTLESVRVLTNVLMAMGEYSTAADKLESLYQEWKGRLERNSSILLAIRYSLGIAYGEVGMPEKGVEILQENCSILHDLYGKSDKQTLSNKKEYALCLSEMGKHDEAIEHLEDCRLIYEKVYGHDGSEQFKNILHALAVEYANVSKDKKFKEITKEYVNLGYSLDDF